LIVDFFLYTLILFLVGLSEIFKELSNRLRGNLDTDYYKLFFIFLFGTFMLAFQIFEMMLFLKKHPFGIAQLKMLLI